jgi:TonB family protein
MNRTTESLSTALVRRAARSAPGSLAARLEEEWLADIQERTSSLGRLRFALGCCWAGFAIGLEHRPFRVTAASSPQGPAATLVEPARFFSSRAVTFGFVLSLHAAIFGGLMMAGSKYYHKSAEPPAIEPHVIDRPAPPIKPAPPQFNRYIDRTRSPPPLLPVEPTEDTPLAPIPADTNTLRASPPDTLASPPRQTVHVQGGIGAGFPHPADYYPDASRRLEEEGATLLRVCVDAGGRLNAEPVTAETSGSLRLDAAAIRLAKAASGHYRPTTEDGRPVPSCYPLKIRFQLRD